MLSIVIPTLNEAENLKQLIPQLYFSLKDQEVEVIIVDGHSTDSSRNIVSEYSKEYPRLRFILQSGKGFANALTEGMMNASGRVIVTMDAENHKASEIPLLLEKLSQGFDVVVGSRFLKGSKVDLTPERFFSTRIANKIAQAALELKIKDTSSGFRAYDAETLKKVVRKGIKTEYFSCQVELLEKIKENGGNLGEVPVHYIRRDKGESKYNLTPALKDASILVEIARDRNIKKFQKMVGDASNKKKK